MDIKICVLGLGYVGLPLVFGVSNNYSTVGFDISEQRVAELNAGLDCNGEFQRESFIESGIKFTNDEYDIRDCNVYMVTVPTPVDKNNIPDLDPLVRSCQLISKNLKKGDVVVFESTVFPGVTEEVCVPILENGSGLKFCNEFNVGYSPERINPGDKKNTVEKINKLLSGSDDKTLELLMQIYKSFLKSDIVVCETIKIAEAAKVLENTQRDVNIALINEFYAVLNALEIDTHKVIEAAATKWNFHKYSPGLVGGHCIGIDPYYFAHKAGTVGIKTNLLLAARDTNEQLSSVIVEKLIKELISNWKNNLHGNILIVGAAYKENCSDFRNTKVVDVFHKLRSYGLNVDIFDPLVDFKKFEKEYNIKLVRNLEKTYKTAIFLVPHDEFNRKFWDRLIAENNLNLIYDFKAILNWNEKKVTIMK